MKASISRAQKQANRWHDDEEIRWTVRQWAVRLGVKAPQVRFQSMKTKWAAISGGWMTLDADLLGIPKDLGEFVIVHELVHQLVPNHGKVFKLFLDAYIPDWEEKERQLQAYAVDSTRLDKCDGGVRNDHSSHE